MARGGLDDTTTEAKIIHIEYNRLARGYGTLRLVKHHSIPALGGYFHRAVLIRLAVTHLGLAAQRQLGCFTADPENVTRVQPVGIEQGVLSLNRDQHVSIQIFRRRKPGLFRIIFQPPDAEPLALTDGVIHQPLMLADHVTVGCFDFARLCRQILFQEVAEATFTDKADAGTVFLVMGDQSVLFSQASNLGLFQLANGEKCKLQFLFTDLMQEITLVLVRVQSLEQYRMTVTLTTANIVTGGDQIGTQQLGILKKCLELDLAVAEDIRVGSAPGLVFFQKVLEYIVPVLGRKVGTVQRDAQFVTHGLSIGHIFLGCTVFGTVVLFPVFHEQAFNLISLLQQQQSRYGRVDTAGHADDHFGLGVGRIHGSDSFLNKVQRVTGTY